MNGVRAALIIFNTAVKKTYWLNVQIYCQFIISHVFFWGGEIILHIVFFGGANQIVLNQISYLNETAQWRSIDWKKASATVKSALA